MADVGGVPVEGEGCRRERLGGEREPAGGVAAAACGFVGAEVVAEVVERLVWRVAGGDENELDGVGVEVDGPA